MNAVKTVQVQNIDCADLLKSFEAIVSKKISEAFPKLAASEKAPEFISRQQVADLFGITLPTVHAWANSGIITPYKIGTKTRFKYSEVVSSPKAIKQGLNRN